MGVIRLMGTLLKHPATKDALIENVPVFECLLIDYNANIHYILQKTITELNEILYFTYCRENMIDPNNFELNEYNLDLELGLVIEELEVRINYYDEEYHIGKIYSEIHKNLLSEDKIADIIFNETINYTRILICSLNKGWIKKVFLALDGTPSMAKIKEQKNRRYINAHINNIKEDIVKKFKFKNNDIHKIDLFYYRSLICTGTKFMDKIQQALFHLNINLDIDVSTLNIKGEGEKKIIHAMSDYNCYNSFCIMSPDSDMLILIGLLSNDPKFDGKKIYNFRIDYQRKNQYQFFDMRQLIDNYQKYFSEKIGKNISLDKMLDFFFMLVVFGNDFLPKLEPLDITQHFDFVCEICLKISSSDNSHFIKDGNINYKYLLDFFKLINNDIIKISIEQSLNDKYNNYYKLCKQMSITMEDLKNSYHNQAIKPIKINYHNFNSYIKILNTAYNKLLKFLKETIIEREDICILYKDIHKNPNDSYLLLVLPRLLKYPGSKNNIHNYDFFEKMVEYLSKTENFKNLRFRNKLMTREFSPKQDNEQNNLSAYMSEIEKINRSMEPYRSIFRMACINLVTFDILNEQLIDLRDKYYEIYVKPNITKKNIEQLVIDYLVGIEWLYQYYICGKHMEWSGWQYKYTQPPLIDDIIKYLEEHPKCQEEIISILSSYPENNMSPMEHYLYVTPNEYTKAGVSPNLSDVVHLIDGYGAQYLNKCQIKWHEYDEKQ